MRKAFPALIITLLALTGCSSLMGATPAPTPTALLLPVAPAATPTARPAQAAATAVATVAPAAPTAAPTVRSTASAAPSATPPAIRLMALGQRASLAVRSAPDAGAASVATLNGAQVTWAEARSADGRWLRVAYSDTGARGWVAAADVRLFGEAASLSVSDAPAAAGTPLPAAKTGPSASPTLAGRVTSAALNVRRGPGVDQPIVGQLAAGDAVSAVGRSAEGDWLAITWQGGQAWVAASLVTLEGKVTDLPALAAQTSGIPAPGAAASGKIVFQTRTGGDIYLVNADGSGLRRLTDGMDPALSPDGSRLAFARWGAPHGIFVLDLRSGAEQRVASANRPRAPAWNADGSQLVFSRSTRSYVCRETPLGCFDDATIRQFFGGQDCIDTAQGRFCISDFPERNVDDSGLTLLTLAGSAWQDLGSAATMQSPAWWPGRGEIIFRASEGLQTVSVAGQQRPLAARSDLGSPAPAPDGRAIAVQVRLNDHSDIFLADAGGALGARLTVPPPTYARGDNRRAPNNVAPAWSPDGRTLLFLSDRDGAWRLYRMNADGSGQALFLPEVLGGISFSYDFAAERVANWGP